MGQRSTRLQKGAQAHRESIARRGELWPLVRVRTYAGGLVGEAGEVGDLVEGDVDLHHRRRVVVVLELLPAYIKEK
jgi:hypothetical protein